MNIQRGTRIKLTDHLNITQPITADISISGPNIYDFCCFGVDENEKLSDERYMIFYNQTASPNDEITIRLKDHEANLTIFLDKLPKTIQKLVLTANIDGDGTMKNIEYCRFKLSQLGIDPISLSLSGEDFQHEKAIIVIEIYIKDVWRMNAVARGFNGGLSDLLKSYGGQEDHETEPSIEPQKAKTIALEKVILEKAPHLVDLSKKLDKKIIHLNLQKLVAQVALVLDASGSMLRQYREGKVQKVLERLLLLALRFDDDGQFELWAFADKNRKYKSVNIDNYHDYIAKLTKNSHGVPIPELGGTNNEAPVIKKVIDHYKNSAMPVFVLFISDGGVKSSREISEAIIKASEKPIFWQFVGIGGRNYGVFEKLDTLKGRYVDNANFFSLDDIDSISDDELYHMLLQEFPMWLQEIKRKNMI